MSAKAKRTILLITFLVALSLIVVGLSVSLIGTQMFGVARTPERGFYYTGTFTPFLIGCFLFVVGLLLYAVVWKVGSTEKKPKIDRREQKGRKK